MKHCPTRLKTQNKKGQTILEIVLSIGLAAMVLSALLVLGAASSKTVASSLRRSQATKLAVQGVEAMRYYRDSQGYVNLTPNCYYIEPSGPNQGTIAKRMPADPNCNTSEALGAVEGNENNTFQRKIKVSDRTVGSDVVGKNIVVTVEWEDSRGNDKVELASILSDW